MSSIPAVQVVLARRGPNLSPEPQALECSVASSGARCGRPAASGARELLPEANQNPLVFDDPGRGS